MKLIIFVCIFLLCFACNSPSTSQASTETDSFSTNSEIEVENNIDTVEVKEEENKVELIQIGTDKVLFSSFGTEPFWNIKIRKSGILFSVSGMDSTVFEYSEPIAAEGRTIDYFMTYFLEDQSGKPAQLVAKRSEKTPCSDGMSDNQYIYHVTFLYKNSMYEGCGEAVTSKQ